MTGSQADAWRRELRNYARRVIARAPHEPLLMAARALAARQARRGAPGDFDGAAPADGPAPRVLDWPVALGAGGTFDALPLAASMWPLAQGAPWAARFADPEDAFAAHRFSWIIPSLASAGLAALPVAQALLDDWLSGPGAVAEGDGWDSYSVAERLAAMVYLRASSARSGQPRDDRGEIRRHARHLAAHLEFRGASTNNHLINDARALYLAGASLADPTLLAQARGLFEFAVPRMFVDGFLREGSTHYHLLLHRTLVEVTLAGLRAGDSPFAERLSEWAAASDAAAAFIHAGCADMPMIGDLSPDFTPAFLARWPALFGDAARECADAGARQAGPSAAGTHAGFFRASAAGFVLHAFVNLDGHVPAWSHAHADLGSFTLSWHGQPLLVDGGRSTYAAGPMSDFGRSVRSHNAIAIDGFEPCVIHGLNAYPELLRSDYRDARPSGRIAADASGARFDITHEGFGRLGSGMLSSRSIALDATGIVIEDRIQGAGRHRVETFFHFAPEASIDTLAPSRWRITLPHAPALIFEAEGPAELLEGVTGSSPMGWTSRRYGSAEPSPSLVFRRETALPVTARYVLRHA